MLSAAGPAFSITKTGKHRDNNYCRYRQPAVHVARRHYPTRRQPRAGTPAAARFGSIAVGKIPGGNREREPNGPILSSPGGGFRWRENILPQRFVTNLLPKRFVTQVNAALI